MSQINNDAQSYIDSLRWAILDPAEKAKAQKPDNSELTQADFFSLITQQLASQDPFKPADNSDMVAQMISMSTTETLGDMKSAFDDLREVMTSNQALQASSLVGRKVLIPTNEVNFVPGETVTGVIALGSKTIKNLRINVENEKGEVVRVLNFEKDQKGNVDFSWDGKNTRGEEVAEGKYILKGTGLNNSQGVDLAVVTHGLVESVTLGNQENPSAVQVRGLGGFPISTILAVGQN